LHRANIAHKECEWKDGDRGGSAEWEQTERKKKCVLTSTGLLMEGLSFIIPDVSDESTFVSPDWQYCQYALISLATSLVVTPGAIASTNWAFPRRTLLRTRI
jgi:hypothetical protein